MRKLLVRAGAALLCSSLAVGSAGCERQQSAALGPEAAAAEERTRAQIALAEGETISAAVRDPDPYSRAGRLGALLPGLGSDSVDEITETLQDFSVSLGGVEQELLVRTWAIYEPEEASIWAVERSPKGYRFVNTLAAVTSWAEQDPNAAKQKADEWLRRPDVLSIADALQLALIRGWYASDPDALTKFIRELGVGMGQQRSLAVLVKEIARSRGANALILWAEALPDDDDGFKRGAFVQVSSALPLFSMDAALRWCDVHCDGPYASSGLRGLIARRWAARDGTAALTWLLEAPTAAGRTSERNFALRGAFERFARTDLEGASAWIAARTEGEDPPDWLNAIYPAYARILIREAPEEAIQWALRVKNKGEQEAILVLAAREWRARDEEAAEAWLSTSPLSEEARASVRGIAEAPALEQPADEAATD